MIGSPNPDAVDQERGSVLTPATPTSAHVSAAGSSSATTFEGLVADARRVLTGWEAPSTAQDDLRGRYLAFLDTHPDAASRDQRAGHLTASTVVLDSARERVLLTLHPLAGRWFQLGGHVEGGDGTVAAAALREATEESGITGLELHPIPIGLDWHQVRCRDRHGVPTPSSHLDFEYVAVAPMGAEHLRSEESLDLAWFALDMLPEGADDVVRGLIARVRKLGLA